MRACPAYGLPQALIRLVILLHRDLPRILALAAKEEAAQHQRNRHSVLKKVRRILQVGLERLRNGDRIIGAKPAPQVGIRDGIYLARSHLVRRQGVQALAQQVSVSLVEAQFRAGGKALGVAKVKRIQHDFSRLGNAAHPVVPTLVAVVGHVELRLQTAL